MTNSKVSFSQINKIALPAIVAGIAEPLISLTDLAIIGGVDENPTESIAAVGIVGSFLSAIIWILAQTKTAISTEVSQKLGANQLGTIKTLIPQILLFNLVFSVLIYLVTAYFATEIFQLYRAENTVLVYSVSYYKIRALGFPLTLLTFAMFGVFRGLQNTLWAMKISIIGGFTNILLSYLLVHGIEGLLPGFHLEGAAYASLLAQFVMFVLTCFYFFKKTPFGIRLGSEIDPGLKGLLMMSGNLFIRTLSLNIAIYLANAYATGYGNEYIAAQSILMNIWLFFSFFIDGYAGAGNAIGGKLKGENNYQKLWSLTKDILLYSVVIAIALACVCGVFYSSIGLIFQAEEMVLVEFEKVFWIVLLMQPINAIAFAMDGIFKGLGEAAFLRNLLLIATFLGFVPAILLGDFYKLELTGIWIAFFVWMLLRSLIPYLYFKKNYLLS